MFKKVRAYPSGDVVFEYGSSKVIVDKNGVSHVRSTLYNKGKYGPLDNLRDNSVRNISDQLY